ncbi:hypothetical protein [Streptomyces longhuiensis]|uniref:hypothetical protein n=1 Tax=Streptomyces longhuiensis TaxID=2880933 RepID=UPI001D0A684C|nr:hypothetical protein [Streptomyces longhuiensis]UDM05543.1 hypothetical protein LGI35_45700 [Streptomyces longhuiensis]
MSQTPQDPRRWSPEARLLLVMVLCLLFGAAAYVMHEHPSLIGPLSAAASIVTLVVLLLAFGTDSR